MIPTPAAKRTILVVDDDADIRDALEFLLDVHGYEVQLAWNGSAAVDMLRGERLPSAILLDLMMPMMDGIEVVERLRADQRLAAIPVLVMTAAPSSAPREHVAGVLAKPFEFERLLTALQDLFGDAAARLRGVPAATRS